MGGATLRLFGRKCTLRKGKQRVRLWRGVEADGSAESSTPSKVVPGVGEEDEMGRLEKIRRALGASLTTQLVKKHERGDIEQLPWLDRLAFREIERIHAVRQLTQRD